MIVSDVVDLLNRALRLQEEPGIRTLFAAITDQEPVRSEKLLYWLGGLDTRLKLILDSSEKLSDIGQAFEDAGVKRGGIDLIRAFWRRSEALVPRAVYDDLADAWREQCRSRRLRQAVGFREPGLPTCTIPPPEPARSRDHRQVSFAEEHEWERQFERRMHMIKRSRHWKSQVAYIRRRQLYALEDELDAQAAQRVSEDPVRLRIIDAAGAIRDGNTEKALLFEEVA